MGNCWFADIAVCARERLLVCPTLCPLLPLSINTVQYLLFVWYLVQVQKDDFSREKYRPSTTLAIPCLSLLFWTPHEAPVETIEPQLSNSGNECLIAESIWV
jgi:hypothetical protein